MKWEYQKGVMSLLIAIFSVVFITVLVDFRSALLMLLGYVGGLFLGRLWSVNQAKKQ